MAPHAHRVRFTYEDYLLFPEDGHRHEIIDGEHRVTPAPTTKHQRISRKFLVALSNFLNRTRLGEVFDAPCDVVLSDLDIVQPDLLFISAARASIVTERNVQGAPDLIVEILSETSRKMDETLKRKLYERSGVQEYWIVDPELERVKVFRLGPAGYGQPTELMLERQDGLTTPLLPGLTLALAELFERP